MFRFVETFHHFFAFCLSVFWILLVKHQNASRAFNGSKSEKEAKRAAENSKKREEKLMQKIGHLTVQVDWLKKKSEEVLGPDWKEKSGYEE